MEKGAPAFIAEPFSATAPAYAEASPPPAQQPLPARTAAWLLQPLRAPEFFLPISPTRGARSELPRPTRPALLLVARRPAFLPLSTHQLKLLHRHRAALETAQIKVLAINIDDASHASEVQAFARREAISFPVLFATEEVAGIYNLIYRYLFDRRRDLGIPTAFLLDRDGMIVKLYQGGIDPDAVCDDAKSIPATAAQRQGKALPFPGTLYQSAFQRNDFTYGIAMFQHGYLDEAASSFEQVIAQKPDYAEGYYNLGTLSLQRRDFPAARRYLEQALKLRPNYPEAWNNLGMMAAQQGQADDAVRSFQQSLLLRPDYATALLNLGNVYRRQGNLEEAQKSLTRALEIQPDDAETNYSLGMFYAQQNQLDRAASFLQKAIDLRPGYAEALNNLGVLYVREQDYAKAEQQFRDCIRITPSFDQAYLNLARLYMMQNDKQRATAILEDLLRLEPENPNAKQAMEALSSMQ